MKTNRATAGAGSPHAAEGRGGLAHKVHHAAQNKQRGGKLDGLAPDTNERCWNEDSHQSPLGLVHDWDHFLRGNVQRLLQALKLSFKGLHTSNCEIKGLSLVN